MQLPFPSPYFQRHRAGSNGVLKLSSKTPATSSGSKEAISPSSSPLQGPPAAVSSANTKHPKRRCPASKSAASAASSHSRRADASAAARSSSDFSPIHSDRNHAAGGKRLPLDSAADWPAIRALAVASERRAPAVQSICSINLKPSRPASCRNENSVGRSEGIISPTSRRNSPATIKRPPSPSRLRARHKSPICSRWWIVLAISTQARGPADSAGFSTERSARSFIPSASCGNHGSKHRRNPIAAARSPASGRYGGADDSRAATGAESADPASRSNRSREPPVNPKAMKTPHPPRPRNISREPHFSQCRVRGGMGVPWRRHGRATGTPSPLRGTPPFQGASWPRERRPPDSPPF